MEAYFPKRFVAQTELEKAMGVSEGKFTIGLGQLEQGFVDDREDIGSVLTTALVRLLETYDIDPRDIGRLEVGTESLVDKSKSAKTSVMQALAEAGNTDVEGVTSVNACYGGTAAVLNTAAWVESSDWDGRYGVVLTGDIAVYDAGPARPTGGCGAVAILMGPEAPLRLVPQSRSTHASDAYDFYKPQLSSEYPLVDGPLSQSCYLRALDSCVVGSLTSPGAQSQLPAVGSGSPAADALADYHVFHAPYNKLVQQSSRRLLLGAGLVARAANPDADPGTWGEGWAALTPLLDSILAGNADAYEETLSPAGSRALDKQLAQIALPGASALYDAKVAPSDWISKRIGNSYTASLWMNVLALLESVGPDLENKSVACFSYGSGAIGTMFRLAAPPAAPDARFTLDALSTRAQARQRLDARTEASPEEFTAALQLREDFYGRTGAPTGSIDNVPDGAFYLDHVDDLHRRHYQRKA